MTRWTMFFNVYTYTNIYISLLIFALYLIVMYSKDIQGSKICHKGRLG